MLHAIPRLTILDRYVMRQLATYAGFALLIFSIVWIAPEILLEAIHEVTTGRLSFVQGVLLIFYQLPEVFLYCIPIAAMVSVIFFFRRFSLSSELTAVLSSGISLNRLKLPVALVGLALSALFLFNQEVFSPLATRAFDSLRYETGLKTADPSARFLTLTEADASGRLAHFRLFSTKKVPDELQLVSVDLGHHERDVFVKRLIAAERAIWDAPSSQWRLTGATLYDLSDAGIYEKIVSLPAMLLKTSIPVEDYLAFSVHLPIAMTTLELAEHVRILNVMQQFDEATYYSVRLFQRLFQPFAPLVLMLISVAFAIERIRSKWNIGLLIAAILLIIYNISISVFTSLGSLGVLYPVIAAACPLLLVTLCGVSAERLRRLRG